MQYNNVDIFYSALILLLRILYFLCTKNFCCVVVALILISTKSKSSRGEGILMIKIINLL